MEFGILGPLEVTELGRPLKVPGVKGRSLLATLLVHRGRVLSTDRLVEELWNGKPPADAANALQVKVSQLRRVVGAGRLLTRSPGYVLHIAPEEVDAVRFERLAAEGRLAAGRAAWEEATAAFQGAEALWRGPALATIEGSSVQIEARRLEEARLNALEDRVDAELALGRHRELVGELQTLAEVQPLRERIWAQLILALYRAGRQSEALRAYQQARRMLVEQLGVEPGEELRALEAAVLSQDPALGPTAVRPLRPAPAPPVGAPPAPALTQFIGRREELALVRRMLREERLVTLTGSGGVGKTRLALEAAGGVQASVPDGVWVVELSPLEDAALPDEIAAVLGMPELSDLGPTDRIEERLTRFLRPKHLVLVLDNCEHVVGAAAHLVEELLQGCPDLRVLATSREPLGVRGEVQWLVPSLGVPPSGAEDVATVGAAEAVQLFVDRAAAVKPGWALSAETAPAVAEICRRLDGIPLGIELAAARVRALPVTEICSHLDDRFRFLVGGARTALPRHQTLRALVEWSYDLLSDAERVAFERLSVFTAGACLQAAEQVCPGRGLDEEEVVSVISRLVDKSLLVSFEGVGRRARYRMLETLGEYGRGQLAAHHDVDTTHRRLAEWLVVLAEEAEPAALGSSQEEWVARLDEEHDNIRAALEWAVQNEEAELALRLCGALGWYWYVRGRQREGRDRVEAALALAKGREISPRVRAKALAWAGYLANADLDVGTAVEQCEEAVRLVPDGDPRARAGTRLLLAVVLARRGDHERVDALLDEAVAGFTLAGDDGGVGWCYHTRGVDLLSQGRLGPAEMACRRAMARFKVCGNRWGMGRLNHLLGFIAEIQGDHADAAIRYEECVAHARALGAQDIEVDTWARLGHLAERVGDSSRAGSCYAEARSLAARVGGGPGNLAGATVIRRRPGLDRARNQASEALEWYRRADDAEGTASTLGWLGFLSEVTGDDSEAERYYRDAVELAVAADTCRPLVRALEGLARTAVSSGDTSWGVTLLHAAAARREEWGVERFAWEQLDADHLADAARAAVGDGCYAAAAARGRSLSLSEMLARSRST